MGTMEFMSYFCAPSARQVSGHDFSRAVSALLLFAALAAVDALVIVAATEGSMDFIQYGETTPMIRAITASGHREICSRPSRSGSVLFSPWWMGPWKTFWYIHSR